RGRGERVPAAERPYRQPGGGRILDRGGDIGLAARPAPPGRARRRGPGPVAPHAPAEGCLGPHYWRVFIFHQRWSTVRACLSTRAAGSPGVRHGLPLTPPANATTGPPPTSTRRWPWSTWARSTGTPPT